MKKVFDKQLLGLEDVAIGNKPIQQIRNGETVELEPINALYDAGLLKDLDREKIPEGVEYLWFKGFYEEGDDGQGIYALVPEDAYYYSEREDDVGLYIKANGRLYEREGSWNKFPDTSIEVLRGEKRHFIMFEWYGAKANDSTYNCFWILEHAYRTIYIKTIELKANQHYYFKQYTNITISRTSSLEVRGNNAYMHFDVFAGQFYWQIPVILDYIILRDINYAGIVPEFGFDGSKCRYFNIYHNSNIVQPRGKGYIYKKDSQNIIGDINVTSLPKINKINYDENAVVNKAYVDSLYKIPDNVVHFDKDNREEITALKQTSIMLERNTAFEDLSDDDIITKEELIQWVQQNIEDLLPARQFKLIAPPTGFEYLQFKMHFKKFTKNLQPYFVFKEAMYVDEEVVTGEDDEGMPIVEMQRKLVEYEYILDSEKYKHTCRLTETTVKNVTTWKCEYEQEGESGISTVVVFEGATFEGEFSDFLEEEAPEVFYSTATWRLNKEENDIRYWEKL